MPHDEHFLSRLDRLSMPLVEFALTLYNDAALVREILGGARAPESATRVALSLSDPVKGPFLVVARDGGFVTCLGEGMSPGPHPIVTRAQIDLELQRRSLARERAETAMRVTGRRSASGALLERIYTAGEFLSREEVFALGLWTPLLHVELTALYITSVYAVQAARSRLTLDDRLRGADKPLWTAFWLSAWATAHLQALLAMERCDDFQRYPEADLARRDFTWGVASHGTQGFALRAAWAAGRMSKALLPMHKQKFAEADTTWELEESALSMLTMVGGRSRLRAEVRKKLDLPAVEASAPAIEHIRWSVGAIGREVLEQPEEALREHALRVGRWAHHHVTRDLRVDHTFRFARSEDIPEALALAALFDARWAAHGDFATVRRTMWLGPAISRLAAEDMYYPKKFHALYPRELAPASVESVLHARRTAERRVKPVVAPKLPGRNDPCVCQSGKKHKKCCGRGAGSPSSRAA